jgi:hypothetical protein
MAGEQFPSGNISFAMKVFLRESRGLFIGKNNFDDAKGAAINIGIDPPTTGTQIRLVVPTNQATICNEISASGIVAKHSVTVPNAAWYYVAGVFENGNMRLYVNGQLVSQTAAPFNSINGCASAEFVLGNWKNDFQPALNGKLDEIRIYNRVLSAAEISYLASTIH